MTFQKHGLLSQLTFTKYFLPVNCFLVEEESALTLVDAAHPDSADAILDTARKIGKPITHIVFTHAHSDHMGAVDALKQKLPDARVMISRRDARLWEDDLELEPGEPQTKIRTFSLKWIHSRPDVLLEEGDRIGSLQAISTPGHTPGSMSFWDERNGAVIAGDAFQTKGGIAVSGTFKLLFPFPALATWNKQEALKSARKIQALKPQILAAGHGEVLHQPMEKINLAINKASG